MKWLIGADLVPTKNTNDLFVKQDFKTLFGDSFEIIKDYDRFRFNFYVYLFAQRHNVGKKNRK